MGRQNNNRRNNSSNPTTNAENTTANSQNNSTSVESDSAPNTASGVQNVSIVINTSDVQNYSVTTTTSDANSSTAASSENTQKVIDIFAILKKTIFEHKEILASSIVVIGIIIYAFGYTYYQGFFEYYGVSAKWISSQQSSFIYSLILPLSGAIVVMFPNVIVSLPLIAKTDAWKVVVFESSWIINTFCILYCCNFGVNIHTLWFSAISIVLLALFLAFISEELNKGYKLIGILILGISLFFIYWIVRKTINNEKIVVSSQQIISLLVVTIFITGIPFVWWIIQNIKKIIASKSQTNSQSTTSGSNTTNNPDNEKQRIKDRNISIIGKGIGVLFFLPICFLLFNSIGKNNAMQKRDYNIICLSENEMYDNASSGSLNSELLQSYNEELKDNKEDIVKESIKDMPYLQIVEIENKGKYVKRIVNAHVIISENDDNYLVINAYVDTNTNNLYIFKSEKREIEKDGQLINSIILAKAPMIV